jgi:hypothetical protein
LRVTSRTSIPASADNELDRLCPAIRCNKRTSPLHPQITSVPTITWSLFSLSCHLPFVRCWFVRVAVTDQKNRCVRTRCVVLLCCCVCPGGRVCVQVRNHAALTAPLSTLTDGSGT